MKKMKDGKLGVEKSKQLEDVLELRDLTIHTGGRRKKTIDAYNGFSLWNFVLNKILCKQKIFFINS